MKYFFILGNNPTLSVAEISAVFGLNNEKSESFGILIAKDVFVLDVKKAIDAKDLIKKLGGVIKIGEIEFETEPNKAQKNIFEKLNKTKFEGKFKYGISCYGDQTVNIKYLGMDMKTFLKERNISARYVVSKEKNLSSVVVEQNKLTSRGMEVVLIGEKKKLFIGFTLAVQPFKELSFRDYGRPGRDDLSGMLPPKLAQIMINLSGAKKASVLLDPFCGSGTVLTEAMLMGFDNLIGSDISKKAIEDTEENIKWIVFNYQLLISNYQLHNKSVLSLSSFVQSDSVDAVVTEPYLGPQRGSIDTRNVVAELENLYAKALVEMKKVLKKKGKIIMIFPVLHAGSIFLNLNILGDLKIVNPIPEKFRSDKFIKLSNRNTIIYGREGQKVFREIVILSK